MARSEARLPGILASALSPFVIGVLRELTGTFASGLWYATILLAISTIAMCAVGGIRRNGRAA
jgi:ACS family 4-hydroxyphenylacetate permease-like MFS transporter